ncbi:MAG: helicase C-terminal domain-containing protein, partial [Spirochaetota bacterium]
IKDKIYEENNENLLLNRSILLFFPSYEFIGMVELFILDSIFDKIVLTKEIKTNNSSSRFFNGQINEIEDFFIDNKIHLIFVPYRSIIQEGANLNFDIAGGFFIGIPFRVPDNQYLTHSILINEYSNLSDESHNNSFEILSLFPALNDVLQSSGRIGRKRETDNFIYFIGKEFLNNKIYDSIIDCYSNVKILKS